MQIRLQSGARRAAPHPFPAVVFIFSNDIFHSFPGVHCPLQVRHLSAATVLPRGVMVVVAGKAGGSIMGFAGSAGGAARGFCRKAGGGLSRAVAVWRGARAA